MLCSVRRVLCHVLLRTLRTCATASGCAVVWLGAHGLTAWCDVALAVAGYKCTFAHGDAELAPKELRQMKRREAEAAMARRQGWAAAFEPEQPVRQRAVADSGEEPAYEEYEKLTAATAPSDDAGAPSGGGHSAGAGGCAGGCSGGCASSTAGAPEMHRFDGTPLDFSSRESKHEVLRQHAIEQIYDAEQASWGLPSQPSAAGAMAALGGGCAAGAASMSAWAALAPRGRGRHIVRPAWLTRQEQAQQR
jgi:hypothetical protein